MGAVPFYLSSICGFYITQKLGVENRTVCVRNSQWSYTGGGSLSISFIGCLININVRRKKHRNSEGSAGRTELYQPLRKLWWLSLYSNTLLTLFVCLRGMQRNKVWTGIFNCFGVPSCNIHCSAWQHTGSQGLLSSPGGGRGVLPWDYLNTINFQHLQDLSHPKLLLPSIILISKICFWMHFLKATGRHCIALSTTICKILCMWHSGRLWNA